MKYSSVTSALACIDHHLQERAGKIALRLPTARTLAREAGVAEKTMLRALHIRRQEGVVIIKPASGIWAVAAGSQPLLPAQPVAKKEKRTELLKRQLFSDVVSRQFRTWPRLPSIKEICGMYGVTFRTATAALNQLEHDGFLVRHRKSFLVSRAAGGVRNEITVIARGIGFNDVMGGSSDWHRLLYAIETGCAARGLKFSTHSLYYRSTEIAGINELRDNLECRRPTVAFIVITAGLPTETINTIYQLLATVNVPVSILDTRGVCRSSDIPARAPWRCFAPAFGPRPGILMADYLLGAGHRAIAYVDAPEAPEWSIGRFAGMKQRVELFGSGAQLFHLALHNETLQPTIDKSAFDSIHALDHATAIPVTRFPSLSFYLNQLSATTDELLVSLTDGHLAFNALDQFLADNSAVTALVGASDRIALQCLDYVASTPSLGHRRIAVAGFDDTTRALANGLTSFNFVLPRVVDCMLDFVVRPQLYEKLRPSEDGAVIIRDSSPAI